MTTIEILSSTGLVEWKRSYFPCCVRFSLLSFGIYSWETRTDDDTSIQTFFNYFLNKLKNLKWTLFVTTKHSTRIFGVSPFFKLQNNTSMTVKRWRTLICFGFSCFVLLFRCRWHSFLFQTFYYYIKHTYFQAQFIICSVSVSCVVRSPTFLKVTDRLNLSKAKCRKTHQLLKPQSWSW